MTIDLALITKYFPFITTNQAEQFSKLKELYVEWNAQINVISRKDIDHLYEHHVLHSLAIAKIIQFKDRTKILDVGTGGGFPGIPLAILFPNCHFHLIDSIGKKIKVVNEVSLGLGLKNISTEHKRVEQVSDKYDFIVSRAVTDLSEFFGWVRKKFSSTNFNDLPNGILYLKGGELNGELNNLEKMLRYLNTVDPTNNKSLKSSRIAIYDLKEYFEEDFFELKKVVYIKG